MFNVSSNSQKMMVDPQSEEELTQSSNRWVEALFKEARAKYAAEATKRSLDGRELEALVREVFASVSEKALKQMAWCCLKILC